MQAFNEAFSRVIIDGQLTAQGWSLADGFSVRCEVVLGDGMRADYVFCDRHGRFLVSPGDAAEQAKNYVEQLALFARVFSQQCHTSTCQVDAIST